MVEIMNASKDSEGSFNITKAQVIEMFKKPPRSHTFITIVSHFSLYLHQVFPEAS